MTCIAKQTRQVADAGQAAALVLAEFLPYRLSILSETVSRLFADHYERRFNLRIPEWRVMAVLGEGAPASTQAVIERTQMDRVRVSRAAIRLADKGLVARTASPGDQRAQLLSLTPRGIAIYREIVPLAFALQARLMHQLTAEEAAVFDGLLTKLQGCATGLASHATGVQP